MMQSGGGSCHQLQMGHEQMHSDGIIPNEPLSLWVRRCPSSSQPLSQSIFLCSAAASWHAFSSPRCHKTSSNAVRLLVICKCSRS